MDHAHYTLDEEIYRRVSGAFHPGCGTANLDVIDKVFAIHIEKIYGHLSSNHLDLSFKAKITEFLDRRHPFGLDSILHH